MGLSPDPEKRANQLRNLHGGGRSAAAKYGLEKPEKPAHEPESDPEPEPPRSGLEVMDYEPPAEPQPQPKPRQRARAKPAKPEPEPTREPAPDPPAAGGGGFLGGLVDGFLGR